MDLLWFVITQKHMIFINSNPFADAPVDKFWNYKLNAIISVTFIASQDDGFSNLLNKPVSYRGITISYNNLLSNYIKNHKYTI